MKLAIIHDELVRKGGAEQVVLSFHKAYPSAPIYTLCYNPVNTYHEFASCNIHTSVFGRYIQDENNLKRFFFPFAIWAMRRLDLTEYDVILQSTTHCSKYIRVKPGTLVLTYCHTPFRLAWRANSYEEVANASWIKRMVYNLVISALRKIDKQSAARSDWFMTNSREVVPRIEQAYEPQRSITVINPPVKCRNFYVSDHVSDYYLVVSRFEPYKRVDLVVEAFNKMAGKKLLVVGSGSMEMELKKMAGPNVTFRSGLNAAELAECYANSKALIFPQLEDYGITPLEANASGRPVIAYGKGGVLDTMIPVSEAGNSRTATAVFFDQQTVESLTSAINQFETLDFDPTFIRRHAERFDEDFFVQRVKAFVQEKYQERPSSEWAVAANN